MTRSIKFRVWDRKNRSFKLPSDERVEGTMFVLSKEGILFSSVNFVFQQFTGLLDKNGKEIYEGDIIQEFPDSTYKSIVNWSKDGLWYGLSLDSNSFGMGNELYLYPKCQVIGNIFENPSLLSQKMLDELKFNP